MAGDNVIPHIESSESEDSSTALDEYMSSASDSSESEQDDHVPLSDNSCESTCVLSPNGSKNWTPKCDEKDSLGSICFSRLWKTHIFHFLFMIHNCVSLQFCIMVIFGVKD